MKNFISKVKCQCGAPIFLMNETITSATPLVGVSAADNTFLVPAVDRIAAISEDRNLNNHKLPNELFDRDVLISEYTIATTDAFSTNLFGDMDPFKKYLQNPLVTKYVSPYQFLNFDLIVTVRIIAPGSCYGCYNIQALCEGGIQQNSVNLDNIAADVFTTSVQDVHGFLNIELKNNVVLELPWEHYLNGYPVASIPDVAKTVYCWRLLLWPLCPLSSTINATATGRVQIYARMGKSRNFVNLEYQSGKDKHPTKPSKTMSMISNGLATVSAMVPQISAFTAPMAAGLAAASTLADAFGFTREANPQLPQPIVTRLTSSLAATDGEDLSEVVALTVGNTLSIDPVPGGGEAEDPMSYGSLFKRWTIIDLFTITSDNTGIVRKTGVTPYGYYGQAPVFGTQSACTPTIGGFVGLPFSYWRGGMEYLIYIPSSSNLQGSLQIFWEPDPLSAGVYPNDPTNTMVNVIIDLKGTSSTHLQVGYSRIEPVLPSVFWGQSSSGEGCNGVLMYKINSQLVAPKVGLVSVNVIVMARPMMDMRFGIPSSTYRVGALSYPLADFSFQAGEEQDTEDAHVIELVPSFPYPTIDIHFGEEILSTRALIQHFCPIFGDDGPSTRTPHYFPYPSIQRKLGTAYPPVSDKTGTNPPFTYAAYYLAPYVGIRGSARYKYIPNLTSAAGYVSMWSQDALFSGPLSFTLLDVQWSPNLAVLDVQAVRGTNGAEWVIPARSSQKYYNPRGPFNPTVFQQYNRVDVFYNPDLVTGAMMYAAGPDMTVTRFRRTPIFNLIPY